MGTGSVASVRAVCVRCGTVDVPAALAQLLLAQPDVDGDSRNRVEFACPRCGGLCSQRIDERATRLLASAGLTLLAPDRGPRRAARGSGSRPA